jgi:hypothetical protein
LKKRTTAGHGGERPGAGRPKGSKNAKTLEREEAKRYLSETVRAEIAPLVRAHLEVAKGLVCMYAKGPFGQWVRVKDPAQIETMLNTANKVMGEDYYLLTAKDPDARALKDIIDREFGKAVEPVELTGKDGGPVHIHHHFA